MDKNEWLKSNRDVCFEQIAVLMEQAALLDVIDNPSQDKYTGQKIAVKKVILDQEEMKTVPGIL